MNAFKTCNYSINLWRNTFVRQSHTSFCISGMGEKGYTLIKNWDTNKGCVVVLWHFEFYILKCKFFLHCKATDPIAHFTMNDRQHYWNIHIRILEIIGLLGRMVRQRREGSAILFIFCYPNYHYLREHSVWHWQYSPHCKKLYKGFVVVKCKKKLHFEV